MVAPDASPEPVKIVVRTYIPFNEENSFTPWWLERKIFWPQIAVLPKGNIIPLWDFGRTEMVLKVLVKYDGAY
jgi:hypothetical protein